MDATGVGKENNLRSRRGQESAMDHRQRQKQYWDSASSTREFTTPLCFDEVSARISPTAEILDIGCGYGRTLAALHAWGYTRLTGLDFSEGMIARGKALYPFLNLRVQESRALPLPDESVDAVLLFAVLTCICDDREQEVLVSEAARVLRPGGLLHVNDFLLNTDERNLTRYETWRVVHGTYGCFELPDGAILRHHSREYMENLLSGFETLSFTQTVYTTMNGNRSNGFSYFGKKP